MRAVRSIAATVVEIDAELVALIQAHSSESMRLGALLCRLRTNSLFKELGFKFWYKYVEARGISMGYAERVMRAHRCLEKNPKLAGLTPEKALLVSSALRRKDTGRSEDEWIGFANTHGMLDLKMEIKKLTRAGILPPGDDPRHRTQALKFAGRDAAVSLTFQVLPYEKEMFREQCRRWGLGSSATLLKLLVIAGTKDEDETRETCEAHTLPREETSD